MNQKNATISDPIRRNNFVNSMNSLFQMGKGIGIFLRNYQGKVGLNVYLFFAFDPSAPHIFCARPLRYSLGVVPSNFLNTLVK